MYAKTAWLRTVSPQPLLPLVVLLPVEVLRLATVAVVRDTSRLIALP